MILHQKTWHPSLFPNAPALQVSYLIFCHGFSWKDLQSSSEDSHIVKIEKPTERSKRRESGAARQGSAGPGGLSLFQAVGYLTGEMKECRSWLKGRQLPGGSSQARETALPLSGVGGGSCSLTPHEEGPHNWRIPTLTWLLEGVMCLTNSEFSVWEINAFPRSSFFANSSLLHRTDIQQPH